MNRMTAVKAIWALPLVLFAALSVNYVIAPSSSSLAQGSGYPPPSTSASLLAYPPPSVAPTPATLPPPTVSEAAQKALQHIVVQHGIPLQALSVQDDHRTEYPFLQRAFQVVTVVDIRPKGQVYKLLVDLADGRIEEDISALVEAEAQAQHSRYGKLEPALYGRLQNLAGNALVPVAVWMAPQSHRTLTVLQEAASQILVAKYPEALSAVVQSGKPMDVVDQSLARKIEAEYAAFVNEETKARVEPLVRELQARRFAVTVYEGMPSFTVTLPKTVILELSQRNDVNGIYLADGLEKPSLDSAVPGLLVPAVWSRGNQGSGVTIAILERGNVDPNNGYLNCCPISRPSDRGVYWHTTMVASCAASFHDVFRGVAPQATILSAGENGTEADIVDALQWAITTQSAPIVNFSAGWDSDVNVNWIDRVFDYWARSSFKTIVVAAGNSGGYIQSPGKGWNVITVGGTDDKNTVTWADDVMWASSAYTNPVSPQNDREKPEVVAVAASISVMMNPTQGATAEGTSLAAPQVSGLAALLINRAPLLTSWPEAQRAIIMASAIHNIEGPSNVVRGLGDLRDGAGAVNADLADQIAQVHGTSNSPCNSSCWWSDTITNSGFPVNTEIARTFNTTTTTWVRVAIAWWSNPDTPSNDYSFDRLDTDLDLRIADPAGQSIAWSPSWDNNYETVEFLAPQPGTYQILIRKARADESSNFLGTALAMIPLTNHTHLPAIFNSP